MHILETLLPSILLLVQLCYAVIYTDTWAAHIQGGKDFAKALSEEHGFTYLGEVLPDIYHLKHRHVVKRSAFASPQHQQTLAKHPKVHWIEQQAAKKRVKRELFNDPKWARMWYMNQGAGLDLNVQEAWNVGITGRDIVVTILDDGIEKDHPDLKANYDPQASYDVNNHDSDPQPRYDYTNENKHGTRCAGEVAAEANNDICSVGVAYKARIGGVKMLDGDVTDAVEAQSLSHEPQHVDIYSASWGPDDDGRTVDGPAALARQAFQDGITRGRGGLGSIFIWASGNGGNNHDNCNCDGYINSIYTLAVSSATEYGKIPWYAEACSSTLATTYSSGSGGERQIVTTDLRKSCTEAHTGTSASAPLAAGITALVLHANPSLTWRDVQHIVVMTARRANLRASDWVVNGVGRNVSHSFGYGLMDAGAMVKLARNWTNVPPQHVCQICSTDAAKDTPKQDRISVRLQSDGCQGTDNEVNFLEHVQAKITLSSSHRGELAIYLTSPAGTKSTLLTRRSRDSSTEGFDNWAFMTTHSWGEFSTGTWTLEVVNGASTATLLNWSLVLYGTDNTTLSSHQSQTPEQPRDTTSSSHPSQKPEQPRYTTSSTHPSQKPEQPGYTTSSSHPSQKPEQPGYTTHDICLPEKPKQSREDVVAIVVPVVIVVIIIVVIFAVVFYLFRSGQLRSNRSPSGRAEYRTGAPEIHIGRAEHTTGAPGMKIAAVSINNTYGPPVMEPVAFGDGGIANPMYDTLQKENVAAAMEPPYDFLGDTNGNV